MPRTGTEYLMVNERGTLMHPEPKPNQRMAKRARVKARKSAR